MEGGVPALKQGLIESITAARNGFIKVSDSPNTARQERHAKEKTWLATRGDGLPTGRVRRTAAWTPAGKTGSAGLPKDEAAK